MFNLSRLGLFRFVSTYFLSYNTIHSISPTCFVVRLWLLVGKVAPHVLCVGGRTSDLKRFICAFLSHNVRPTIYSLRPDLICV